VFERIIGQHIAVKMLSHEITKGMLPASVMFHGMDGCGKFLVSVELARVLNCKNTGSSECTCNSCGNISKLISRNLFLICKSNLRNTFILWERYGVRRENLFWFYRDLQRLLLTIHGEQRFQKYADDLEGFLRSPYEIADNFSNIILCVQCILDSLKGINISIERIRELRRFLWFKGNEEGFKVVIIDGAENMNEESSNSFLKISEDTPPDSLIILTTVNRALIKETIQSRFRAYRFIGLSDELRKQIIKERFGASGEEDADIKNVAVNEYVFRLLKNGRLHLLEFHDMIKEIIEKDQVISFLDALISSLKKSFSFSDEIKTEKLSLDTLYHIETQLKNIDSVKKAILFGNANLELVFTNFMLNNYRFSIK